MKVKFISISKFQKDWLNINFADCKRKWSWMPSGVAGRGDGLARKGGSLKSNINISQAKL